MCYDGSHEETGKVKESSSLNSIYWVLNLTISEDLGAVMDPQLCLEEEELDKEREANCDDTLLKKTKGVQSERNGRVRSRQSEQKDCISPLGLP